MDRQPMTFTPNRGKTMAADRRTTRREADKPGKSKRAKPAHVEAAGRPLDREVIVFRHLGAQVGPGCTPGWWWVAELYDDRPFPHGQAWVMVVPPDVPDRSKYSTTVEIFYVQVADASRRRGVATRLVRAIRERWPEAKLTPPISKAGQRLHAKFVAPLEPEDIFNRQALKRFRAQGMSRDDILRFARGDGEAARPFEPPPAAPPKPAGRGRTRRTGETK
jgi:GNAT superfamily N-acetyltransferase